MTFNLVKMVIQESLQINPWNKSYVCEENTSEKLKIKVFPRKRSVSSTLINQQAASKILNKSASFTAIYLTFITILGFSK